jgi:hypothetical protein
MTQSCKKLFCQGDRANEINQRMLGFLASIQPKSDAIALQFFTQG